MGKLYFTGFYYCIVLFVFPSCQENAPIAPPPAKEHTASEQVRITTFVVNNEDLDSLDTKARTLLQNGQSDSAKWLWMHAASRMPRYSKQKALAFKRLGKLYYNENNCDSALSCFKYSLNNLQNDKEENGIKAGIYGDMGGIYYIKKQFDSATYYLYNGLTMLHRTSQMVDYKDAYTVYDNLAWFLYNMNQPEMAQYYLNKARVIALQHQDTGYIMKASIAEATLYIKKDQLDKAIKLYETVISEESAEYDSKLSAYGGLALIYAYSKDQQEKALYYLEKGLDIINNHSEVEHERSWLLYNLGVVYLNIAQQTHQDIYYRRAKDIYKNICRDLEETDKVKQVSFEGLKSLYRNYAIACYGLGQYKEAADLYRKSLTAKDDQYGQNIFSQINQSELQYRTAAKDKLLAQNKLQLSQQQNKIQRQYMWIGGITSIALIAALLFIVVLRRKQHRTELVRLKGIIAGEEKERTRIAHELHDGIVSQLSAIKINFSNLPVLHPDMNEASDDFQSALHQLEQSIAELRNASHNLLPEILQRTGLAEAIDTYCREISRMTSCAVEFILVGALPKLKQDFQLTIYRIIQELLQNVIKHSGATDALVQFNAEPAMLRITVDDNGSGLTSGQLLKLSGTGLSNLRQRVAALQGKMEIETEDGKGTSVYLSFDLSNNIEKS